MKYNPDDYDPEKRFKYFDPQDVNIGSFSAIEELMQPFYELPEDPNWGVLDLVSQCIMELPQADQDALYGVFYDRLTYDKLADTLGIKAKSHAWRRTQQALEKLKYKLLEHPEFIERTKGKYESN